MEGVYAALAIVGAVTGYGFSKAKKQSTKKYTLSADDIRVTTTAGAVVDGLFQNSPHKPQAYDCLLNKLPGWVRTKAAKTLELYNQSKASGAPPSVAYTNIRLGLLQDRELGNITASQELYFPKREQFYQWFKECIAAGPMGVQPVTPESARMPRSGSEFTDRSQSQFSDRTARSQIREEGWGGEETPVPLRLMDLETKRTILQRMGITDRATFGQWAETHRRTNPQRVAEIEAVVNEVFPMTGWTPGSETGLWRPAPIQIPATPAATGETPLPTETPAPTPTPAPVPQVTVPPPAPAPTQGVAPRISFPPQLPPAPAPAETVPLPSAPSLQTAETVPLPSAPSLQTAETVPLPSAPSAETVAQAQRQQATPSTLSRLGQAFRAPFTRRNARVVPADAPQPQPQSEPQPVEDIVVNVPAPAPRERQSMASRWRTQRARRNLFGRQPPAPAPVEFEQVNPMLAPAPIPPPAPAVTQRQRPSFFSRLRNVTLRAPRGATPKQNAAKATLDQLGITDVATFSTYIQGKSSTEQMNALQNGVIAYPDDADLLLDAMTADETAGTAFAQSSNALKKPIQKAADKARKKRPAALVTAPSAISAMTAAPSAPAEGTTPEEIAALTAAPPAPVPQPPPTKVSEIRPATAVGPSGIPPHMRGLVTPRPSAFVRETPPAPSVAVPTPAPAPAPPSKEELLTYLREQTPPIVDMNSFLAWTKANGNTLSKDEILRVYKMAIEAFPASAAPLTSAPRVQAVPLPIPAATPQQIEELRGFLARQTPPITDLASLQQWMRANESKSVHEKENIFLLYERVFQTSVNRDFILGPAAPAPAPLTVPAPPPSQPRTPEEMEAQLNEIAAAGTGLGLVAPPPAPELPSEVATPLPISAPAPPRRARDAADERKQMKQGAQVAASRIQSPDDFKNWLILYNTYMTYAEKKQVLLRLMDQYPTQAGDFWVKAMSSSGIFGTTFRDDQDIRAKVLSLRQAQPMDELNAILNAPTPTPASQASAATASSGEVWTAEPPASIPAPPPGPPPESALVPPGNLNSGQAKEWLRTNLGVENQQDFRRWIRENTSKVTEPILTNAEIAYPMGTLAGTTNFRTVYEALKSGKTLRATTQRQGGRKARKNTLRRRPGVNTKNVRRSSYRKNRTNRRN